MVKEGQAAQFVPRKAEDGEGKRGTGSQETYGYDSYRRISTTTPNASYTYLPFHAARTAGNAKSYDYDANGSMKPHTVNLAPGGDAGGHTTC